MAQNERIRVSIRLRPVSREEVESYPPPWPVQPLPGEVRIYQQRTSRPGATDRVTPRAATPPTSSGGGGPPSPRTAPSYSFPVVKQWWHQQQHLYPNTPVPPAAQGAQQLNPQQQQQQPPQQQQPHLGQPPQQPSQLQSQPHSSSHQQLLQQQMQQQQMGSDYQSYSFDTVFSTNATNADVYEESGCREIVESACSGCNGTVFLYGQTGSGKTYTHEAITRAAVSTIFGCTLEETGREVASVTLSVVEIYCETIRCLLSGKEVILRQQRSGAGKGGIILEGAGEQACTSEEEVLAVVETAKARRAIGETRANPRSSRSHLVVRVRLEVLELSPEPEPLSSSRNSSMAGVSNACEAPAAPRGVAFGQLFLVDLAGSERVEKSGSDQSKSLLREAQNINRSLLVLGNVVTALMDRAQGKKVHVPYRDSKLTRLLEDAIGGSARTALIACATPLPGFHLDQLRATLEFAARAANIVCRPQRNVVALEPLVAPDAAKQLALLQQELASTRSALAAQAAECEVLRARLAEYEAAAAAPSPLERLQARLSMVRRGRVANTTGGSGSWGGAVAGSLEDSAGGLATAEALRRSWPGPVAASAPLLHAMHRRCTVDGLKSLLHPGGWLGTISSSDGEVGGVAAAKPTDDQSVMAPSTISLRKWSTMSGHESSSSAALRSCSAGGVGIGSLSAVSRGNEALLTGGSARRASEGDDGGSGTVVQGSCVGADAVAAPAGRSPSLAQHMIRQLAVVLSQKKAEVRQLKEQAAELTAALAEAQQQHAAKEARLQQVLEGVARLGAARQEEFARWSGHLQGLEASLQAAHEEVQAHREEAAALHGQLAEAGARYAAQAEELQRARTALAARGGAGRLSESGPLASPIEGAAVTSCSKCESTKPLLAFMHKLKGEVATLRAAVADRDSRLAAGAEALAAARGRVADLEAQLAHLRGPGPIEKSAAVACTPLSS